MCLPTFGPISALLIIAANQPCNLQLDGLGCSMSILTIANDLSGAACIRIALQMPLPSSAKMTCMHTWSTTIKIYSLRFLNSQSLPKPVDAWSPVQLMPTSIALSALSQFQITGRRLVIISDSIWKILRIISSFVMSTDEDTDATNESEQERIPDNENMCSCNESYSSYIDYPTPELIATPPLGHYPVPKSIAI